MKQKRKRRLFSRENIGIFFGMVISLVPFVAEYCVVKASGFCECYWTTQLTVG